MEGGREGGNIRAEKDGGSEGGNIRMEEVMETGMDH